MRTGKRNRLWAMAALAVVLFVALAAMPVAAQNYVIPYPQNNQTYVPVANAGGARFPSTPYGNAYYYINLTNTSPSAGARALHITNSPATDNFAGQDTSISGGSNTGTFYISDYRWSRGAG